MELGKSYRRLTGSIDPIPMVTRYLADAVISTLDTFLQPVFLWGGEHIELCHVRPPAGFWEGDQYACQT